MAAHRRGKPAGPVMFEDQAPHGGGNAAGGALPTSPGSGEGALGFIPPFVREFFGEMTTCPLS